MAILYGAKFALCVWRDGVFAAIADEVGALGVLGGASEAGGMGVKFAVLYRVRYTAHFITSFSRRKQKSQRGSFSFWAAFSMELLITCMAKPVPPSPGAHMRRVWRHV